MPSTTILAPAPDPEWPAPGMLRRLGAIIYDWLLLAALWFATTAIFVAASGGLLASPDRPLLLLNALRVALLLVTFLFFGYFWTRGGQTLGMRAWRLKLISTDGGPVSRVQAVRRFAAAFLSAVPCGLGFLWVLVDPEKLAWHDRLSDTRLVRLPKTR
jgi:uncharacterized RDD family membrane protein YckC